MPFNYIWHWQLVAFLTENRCCLWLNLDSVLCIVHSLNLVLELNGSNVMLCPIVWQDHGYLCVNLNLLHSKQYSPLWNERNSNVIYYKSLQIFDWNANTYSNKSSLGPLRVFELGPIASLLLLHGDLNIDLLSESQALKLSLVMVVAEFIVLIKMKKINYHTLVY